MRKRYTLIWILLSVCMLAEAQSFDRQALRAHYQQIKERRSALDSFITALEKSKKRTPVEDCYLGISYGLSIQYINGMWGKYRVLVKSRDMLNGAVQRDPADPEIRFMRLALEDHIPAFLCMSVHMNEDITEILSHGNFIDDNPDLKSSAIQYIIDTKRGSPDQIRLLEAALIETKMRLTAQK